MDEARPVRRREVAESGGTLLGAPVCDEALLAQAGALGSGRALGVQAEEALGSGRGTVVSPKPLNCFYYVGRQFWQVGKVEGAGLLARR